MSIWTKIFGGVAGGIAGKVADIADRFIRTKEETSFITLPFFLLIRLWTIKF